MHLKALLKALLIGTALLLSPLSFAAWREAKSEHFVIYADESERNLRAFSEKLERYHQAMTIIFPSRTSTPSPSNRLTIYVVSNDRQVRKLFGNTAASDFVSGFYIPRAGSSSAFIPSVNSKSSGAVSESEMILMHEYAHHFMFENLNSMVPPWFVEGFAEYFAAVTFERNGNVILGGPDNLRAHEFVNPDIRQIGIEELLDSATHAAQRRKSFYDNFYVRSWSLFHYLYSDEAGKGKMVDYLNRLNRGENELDAARAAFGDLAALDQTLGRYLRGQILSWRIPSTALSFAPIAIRELNPAEAASLAVRMQSKRGVDPNETAKAAAIAQEARELAVKYPNEPEVLAALAEAESDAGNDAAAIAAADKALALNPTHINALIQKGYALTRSANASGNAEDWAKVRTHFLNVNKIEADHPIPLIYFYLSYVNQGMAPTQNAIDGLEWALQLAPYDASLRLTTARAQMAQRHYQQAIQTLSVLAFNPHNDGDNPALALLETAKQALAEQTATLENAAEK
ncbi:MAG: hypothetical protein LBF16_08660 [Pseudomonadales bacterium]|jgi:tetratricopeptide (TPR) repeat protein|nr:hypothetical protein [Pseudomonadales bacterium]